MRNTIIIIAALGSLALAACSNDPASTEAINLNISGSVIGPNSEPLSGAIVNLTLPSTEEGDTLNAVIKSAQTDATGHFVMASELLGFQCRQSTIVVQKAGFIKRTLEAEDGYQCSNTGQTLTVRLLAAAAVARETGSGRSGSMR